MRFLRHFVSHLALLAGATVVVGASPGCANGEATDDTAPAGGDDSADASPSDAGPSGKDAARDAVDGGNDCPPGHVDLNHQAADGCEYACTPGPAAPSDPIDPSFTDENCDGSDGVVAKCVFVAADGT